MTAAPNKIRVLVVDDSALMRKLIPQLLERDSSIQVVGTAMDGAFAIKKIAELKPDAITLDLEMPRMDGIETLRQIMRQKHAPVVVVSSHTREGASTTFKALHMGAFDFVAKPPDVLSDNMGEIAAELIAKIKTAVSTPILSRPTLASALAPPLKLQRPSVDGPASKVIAIGISTGGPNSLEFMLSHLPGDFPAAIVVVQHMPAGFTEAFARRLNESCALEVKEAQSGDLLSAGRVLVSPGDRHMRVRRMPLGDVAVLSDDPKTNGHRPSVDVLFRSVAQEFGSDSIGLLMTGMGEDGAEGLGVMKSAGAVTLAQDEQSSIVFGMPRAAIERGYATRIVSLEDLSGTLMTLCSALRPMHVKDTIPVRTVGQL
jgi:two-component system chemotaxis response regulator CheB